MKTVFSICISIYCIALQPALSAEVPALPDEWIDPDTGHRIVHLSRLPGISHDFYFHQNCFTADGRQLTFTNIDPHGMRRICVVDMKTFECRSISDRNFEGPFFQELAPKSHQVFYLNGSTICAADADTGKNRVVATIPQKWTYGRGFSVNADETLLVGCASVGEKEVVDNGHFATRQDMIAGVWAAKLPAVLYTIEIATGQIQVILKGTDWYGHVQFSPTDPHLIMFCHEGPWQKVQRIWTIRTDGTGLQSAYQPELPTDVAGHEFWSPDGNTIWYDQVRAGNNALGQTSIPSLKQTRLPLENGKDWNVHYCISPDQKILAGDGSSAAPGKPRTTQWIRLITETTEGKLHEEPVANLAKQDYHLEPNVHLSPDDQWIVYQANISGNSQVYAVSTNKVAQP